MTLKIDAKFEEKLTLGFKNQIKNLVNFNASSGKSANLHFDLLLLSITCKVSAKTVQKSYLSFHWTVTQILKKNWLFVWKMIWESWWILMQAVESLKTCTFMGYFCRKYVMFELKKYTEVASWKWLMISKMTSEIWWIFTQVVESNLR